MRRAVAVTSAVGAAISAYLTWVHYSGDLALCIGVGGCEAVQGSRFAVAAGVPVAVIGLGGFAVIFALAVLRLRPDPPAWADTAIFALSVAATVYVAYLTYIELFVLGAVCPWCVAVALCSVLVLALVGAELLRPRRS
ncbi:MAG TPA: vitamin K epoxide reductase family protein [Candidatus Limnocylindria bacterium]|nr:vitamin K epoxide reductase family protein [Candidatus Limnocylindria bacterium]